MARVSRPLAAYCLLAALVDGATGQMLIVAPALTLRLMGVEKPAMDPVLLRFIGAFVLGVGLAYLLPFACGEARDRLSRVVVIFEVTALVRFCVGSFVLAVVLSGRLEPAWASVAGTDLGLAVVQVVWRRKLRRQASGGLHG